MRVKQRMTPNPITASPKTTHHDAIKLMREHNFRRLPIIDMKHKLVGIVSMEDLLTASPSPATSLSIYEIHSLLSKLTLDQIMISPVHTVHEDCDIAAAANFMLESKVGCLPVINDADEIIGIITETDIYRTFVEVLGGGQPGLRIDLRVDDKPGILADIANRVGKAGGNIMALTVFRDDTDVAYAEISIKEMGASESLLRQEFENMPGLDQILRIRQNGQDQLISAY